MDTPTQKPVPVHVHLWNFLTWIMLFAVVITAVNYDLAKDLSAWKSSMALVLIFNMVAEALVWFTYVPDLFDKSRPHYMRRLLRYGIYPAVSTSILGTLVLILDSNMTEQGFISTWFDIGKWLMGFILVTKAIASIKLLKLNKITRANTFEGRIGSIFSGVLLCLPVTLIIAIEKTCWECRGNWLSLNDIPSAVIVISILATYALILAGGLSGLYGMWQREKDLKKAEEK